METSDALISENSDCFNHENDMEARYQRAQTLMQGANGIKKLALNTTVIPFWIGDTDSFWYVRETKKGKCFRRVDAEEKTNIDAFDHQALACALAEQTGEEIDFENLPLTDVEMDCSIATVTFNAFESTWEYDDNKKMCKKIKVFSKNEKISPDGKKSAFVRDSNIWIKDIATGQERALTNDGSKFYVYGSVPTIAGNALLPILDFLWSPDSTQILTQVTDTMEVSLGNPIVQYVPSDGSLRPTILRPDRRVAYLSDEKLEAWQILTINVKTGDVQKADYKPCPITYPHYKGYFCANRGWWGADSRHAYFIYHESDDTETRVLKWDTYTGKINTLVEESPKNSTTLIPANHTCTLATPLPASDELIWYSERSGWAHLYLYDATSGELKNTITSGDWVVRNILHYDAEQRELVIQTAGRVEGRNPYYQDICRVNIDTGKLTALLSTDHEYVMADKKTLQFMIQEKSSAVSSNGRYIVATRSRVDDVPVSLLLDRKGQELLVLETADISEMPENWQWPEPVMLKGADDKTDIYGIVFRPSNFSPDKSYPVLDLSFSFSEPAGSFTNNAQGHYHYLASLAYAELGFIVVKIDNRGDMMRRHGVGLRNRAFREFRDTSVPAHNMADCVAGIEQLCKRYSYMDLERVGVADYTSIPAALTGMLVHSNFYKVGVSQNPGDPRFLPINRCGIRKESCFPSHEFFADNLCGKLLLMHGMLEDANSVANTFRVIEALRIANKNFDMLLLPNVGHGSGAGIDYFMKRGWDYLVSHLLGTKPPENFKLTVTESG